MGSKKLSFFYYHFEISNFKCFLATKCLKFVVFGGEMVWVYNGDGDGQDGGQERVIDKQVYKCIFPFSPSHAPLSQFNKYLTNEQLASMLSFSPQLGAHATSLTQSLWASSVSSSIHLFSFSLKKGDDGERVNKWHRISIKYVHLLEEKYFTLF